MSSYFYENQIRSRYRVPKLTKKISYEKNRLLNGSLQYKSAALQHRLIVNRFFAVLNFTNVLLQILRISFLAEIRKKATILPWMRVVLWKRTKIHISEISCTYYNIIFWYFLCNYGVEFYVIQTDLCCLWISFPGVRLAWKLKKYFKVSCLNSLFVFRHILTRINKCNSRTYDVKITIHVFL